ncbi:MAG: hypothetical protein FD135_1715 [Comamonadaceae bacterium]|nr:MAG: hypothetical protein FD135_1715 [Comamonadaceae bacterium]
MKKLIICNDGTWNTADQEENGIPTPTNVVKLYHSLAEKDEKGLEQLKYYHPGVGTNGLLDSITGGALGAGVSKQIQSAYHWLATHYERGDQIFIYGFSRGAFIARSLAGFLGRGLLDLRNVAPAEAWSRVKTAYDQGYRKHATRAEDDRTWAEPVWVFFHGAGPTPVHFVGVWDTVGALGIPDDMEVLNLFDDSDAWKFHDTALGSHIHTARHAMAMDEVRASFTVTRWSNTDQHLDAKEVWFPGVHSDVGGGYANTDLSDGALQWMLEESVAVGLALRPGIPDMLKPNPLGVLHNSYKGVFAKFRSRPRSVEALIPGQHDKFHPSAIERHEKSPIAYSAYRPTRILNVGESCTVDVFADTHWNDTGLYLEAGHSYTFSATGEWLDSKDACDWKGTENDEFTAGDLIRSASSLFGKTEALWKKIAHNSSTDFIGTKRVEHFRWFTLVGAIANDCGVGATMPNDGSPTPHQYVNLPDHVSTPLIITSPGYLFCFPNDVWSLYGNNHGSVSLTITRVA